MPHPHHARHLRPRSVPALAAAAGLTLAGLAVVAGGAPATAGSLTVVVNPGESIQAAVDGARQGTTIVVAGGVHAEQVTITTDGLTLIGQHTSLVPPATPATNPCSGFVGPVAGEDPPTEAGFCVIGHDVVLAPFVAGDEHRALVSAGRPVRSVRIEGFDVEGFSGPYVTIVHGRDVTVADNRLTGSTTYGVLSAGSRSTRVTGNEIHGPSSLGFIGVCVDDEAAPLVDRNDIAGQVIGVCVETTGASVDRNDLHDNCIGVYVDPGIGATITRNTIVHNDACPDLPPSIGQGVMLSGAHGTVVRGNVFAENSGPGGAPTVLIADEEGTGTVATGNVVTHNEFHGNTLDIASTATGDNRIAHNDCATSIPSELCS